VTKRYDRAYFDRWYRHPETRILLRSAVARKAALAVSAAEFVLGRTIRSVLDVGCGEAPWRAPLLAMRPGLRYVGVDGSEYAVRRFGRARNIRLGRVGELGALDLDGPYDLVVCSDVLHYVPAEDLGPGIRAIASLTHGLAWIEIFTSSDSSVGDHVEYRHRPRASYDRWFKRYGLIPIGLYSFVPRALRSELTTYEIGRA
jgi:SAM-dependent methyltransferase